MKTITQLPSVNTVAGADLLIVETNPSSAPNTKTITVSNLFNNITSNTVSANTVRTTYLTTPSNSTINVAQGTIFFDSTYAYFAVANNVLKRVALSSF